MREFFGDVVVECSEVDGKSISTISLSDISANIILGTPEQVQMLIANLTDAIAFARKPSTERVE